MNVLLDLYNYAQAHGVDVDWFPMARATSLSAMLPDGTCCIAMDPWKLDTIEMETLRLAHELGHCETGAFYNRWAACDVVMKHENWAEKWAIEKLVPKDELDKAVQMGYTEPWELAEHFSVTQPFMEKAMEHYRSLEINAAG